MRKKFFVTAIMIIFTIICCCSCAKEPQSFSDEYFTYENLFREYAEGNWNGEFISSDNHCAKVYKITREFCIDNETYFINLNDDSIPIDIYHYSIDCQLKDSFRDSKETSEKGTYYYNENDMLIELWKLGELVQTWTIPDEYKNKDISLDIGIMLDKHHNAILYSYIYSDNCFILKDNGKMKEIEIEDIKHKKQWFVSNKKNLPNLEPLERYTKYDEILNSDWNGEFTKTEDGEFVSITGSYMTVNCEDEVFLGYEYPVLLSDWREKAVSRTAGIDFGAEGGELNYWIIVEDEAKNLHKQIWHDGELMEDSPVSPEEIYD